MFHNSQLSFNVIGAMGGLCIICLKMRPFRGQRIRRIFSNASLSQNDEGIENRQRKGRAVKVSGSRVPESQSN